MSNSPERRVLLKGLACMSAGWILSPSVDAQGDQAAARPMAGDQLVNAADSPSKPLGPDDIPAGSGPVEAWAMEPAGKIVRSGSRLNKILLVKLDAQAMSDATRAVAAGGVVAYTAICTHEGCEIGSWIAAEGLLYCECHESKFDPRDLARVADGPARRSLPALPLKVEAGLLIVAAPFTGRIGGEVA